MKKLALFVSTMLMSLAAGALAIAHTPSTATDCDTWSRDAHVGTSTAPSHHDTSGHGVNHPLADGWQFHQSQGHYMLFKGANYIEVVGGGQYEAQERYNNVGEGGYVQGHIEPGGAAGTNEVDFHFDLFGPTSELSPAFWHVTHAEVCVSVNNTKVGQGIDVPCPVQLKPILNSLAFACYQTP